MNAFRAAVREWQEKTCIRFQERTREAAYVEFVTGKGGYAWCFFIGEAYKFVICIFSFLDVGPMVSDEMVITNRQSTWIPDAGEKELWCMKSVSFVPCALHFSAFFPSCTENNCIKFDLS